MAGITSSRLRMLRYAKFYLLSTSEACQKYLASESMSMRTGCIHIKVVHCATCMYTRLLALRIARRKQISYGVRVRTAPSLCCPLEGSWWGRSSCGSLPAKVVPEKVFGFCKSLNFRGCSPERNDSLDSLNTPFA